MKQNMWLLIVLIVMFIVLQFLFFKALNFKQFEFSFDIETTLVDDIKQKVVESVESNQIYKKQTATQQQSKTKYTQGDQKELYRKTKKLINNKKYKKALTPISELIEMNPSVPKYWYEKIRALYGLQDCEVMGAMEMYLNLCKTSDDCFKGGVEWSEKSYDRLKETYCKS